MYKQKFVIQKNSKGYYFSIKSSNGKNLNPSDIQKQRRSVKNAIAKLIKNIKENKYEIHDITLLKPLKKK